MVAAFAIFLRELRTSYFRQKWPTFIIMWFYYIKILFSSYSSLNNKNKISVWIKTITNIKYYHHILSIQNLFWDHSETLSILFWRKLFEYMSNIKVVAGILKISKTDNFYSFQNLILYRFFFYQWKTLTFIYFKRYWKIK